MNYLDPFITLGTLWKTLVEITNGAGGKVLYAEAERRSGLPALQFEAQLRVLINARRCSIGGRGVITVLIPAHECRPLRVDRSAELAKQRQQRAVSRAHRQRKAAAVGRPEPRRNACKALGEVRCKDCHDIKNEDQFHLLWRAGRVYRDRMCKRCRTKVQLWTGIRIWTEGASS